MARDSSDQPELRAKALRGLAVLAIKHRDYGDAERFLDESLALSRELGDTASAIRSMLSLGVVAVDTDDYEQAKRLNRETLELARETGDGRVVATAINNLSDLALVEGEYELAATPCRREPHGGTRARPSRERRPRAAQPGSGEPLPAAPRRGGAVARGGARARPSSSATVSRSPTRSKAVRRSRPSGTIRSVRRGSSARRRRCSMRSARHSTRRRPSVTS